MRTKIIVIVFLFFVVKPAALFSSEAIPLDSKDLDSLRDPFTPQLPLPPAEEIQKPAGEQNLPSQAKFPLAEGSPPPSQKIPQSALEEPLKPPVIKISGLIWNSANPQAIINDRIVRVGDKIEAWTIEKINKNTIEISAQGKKVLIPAGFGVLSYSVKESANPNK